VKNRRAFMSSRLLVSIAVIAFALGCQKTQLTEYKAYQSDADVPRISVADAKKDVDAGIAVIVDSRDATAYKMERVAGSINMKMGATTEQLATLPRDKKIIVYCS
jgi:hypothetical protein